MFQNKYRNEVIFLRATPKIPIIGTNKESKEELYYASISEAASSFGVNPGQISRAIITGHCCHEYFWRKVGDPVQSFTPKIEHFDLQIPIGLRQKIKQHARGNSETTNTFILRAIQETMSRES